MSFIKNKIIYILGALFLATAVIVAVSIWQFGLIPIKHYVVDNAKLNLKFMDINKNIERLKIKTRLIIYYEKVKPLNYKDKLKQTLDKTKILIKKTDLEYKNTAVFIKKTEPYGNYDAHVIKTFKKFYFRWEIINKPIFKRFIRYPGYIAPKISYTFFSKYLLRQLSSSILPSKTPAEKVLSYFEHIIGAYFFIFIFGTVIVIILGILLIYYFDKFFNAIRGSEQRFKTYFYRLPAPSLIIDVETGIIIDANEKATDFYGYSNEEFKQMTMFVLNPFMPNKDIINIRTKAINEGYNYWSNPHIVGVN
ncbi:MAG: PAS domain S-box protein [bacterium]